MTKKVSILKYGTGNLHSIERAIKYFGYEAEFVQTTKQILNSDRLILPGIGASKYVMDYLSASERNHAINELVINGRPILGICLGMQILLSENEEFGVHQALDIMPGKVKSLNKLSNKLTIPHMGWSSTVKSNNNKTILNEKKDYMFYYAHSFYCKIDKKYISATCDYQGYKIPSIIHRDNVWGVQFHPELSSIDGLKIIERFISI